MSQEREEIFDVFLSHSHTDAEWVEELAKRLEDRQKLKVWLDVWELVPGESFIQGMARGINQANSCAVCISKQTPKGWFQQEIERALNRKASDPSFRVIPLLLPDAETYNVDDFLGLKTWVHFKEGIDDEMAFHRLICGIKGLPPGRGPKKRELDPALGTAQITPTYLPEYSQKLKGFVDENRGEEINQDLSYLQDHHILLISGVGGVGKTTLARALVENRPDTIPLPFWFDFRGRTETTLGDVLEKLADYMNTPNIALFKEEGREAGQDDIRRLMKELNKNNPLWLIFDNLETILDEKKCFHDPGLDSFFSFLRDGGHKAKIIITSRIVPEMSSGEGLVDILDEKQELKGLKTGFAVDYLVKNGLGELEPSQLEELAIDVDGHPLALKLLIGVVKKFGIQNTLNDLSTFKRHKEKTIKKARNLFAKLAGDEKELLERISVLRLPEPMSAIQELFTNTTTTDAVENLIDKSLLETDHEGSYWLHPLVREFAYDDLENKKEVHEIAMQYFLSVPLPEERSSKEDIQPLIEAHYHACRAENYNMAYNIIIHNNLYGDLDRWGNYRILIDLYNGILPRHHFNDKSLLDDISSHSTVMGNLGLAYSNLGQVDKAIQYFKKALKINMEIRHRAGEGIDYGFLGSAYSDLGQLDKSIQYFEKALRIAKETGDIEGEVAFLGSLGNAHNHLGQIEKAIQYYEKALVSSQSSSVG